MSPVADLIRDRVDVKPAHHRPKSTGVGVAVIALILLALVSAALRHIPLTPTAGRVFTADFRSADQISSRTVVRVGGVDVGSVAGVGPGPNPYDSSTVSMRITDDSVNLYANASAQIRWRTVFGGVGYIDLHPGTPSAGPLSGSIPISRTGNQVELDELLDTYSGTTPQE